MQRIPEIFHSSEDYFPTFVYPLLEETRAQLFSAMETISEAPFAQVVDFEESKPYGTGIYDFKVDGWKNRVNNHAKEPYKTLPGDVFILADVKPETVADLQRVGTMWTFLSVTNITEDERDIGSTSSHFKVKMSKNIQLVDMKNKSFHVVFMANVLPHRRIWNSLHMYKNLNIIDEILCPSSVVSI